MYKSISLLFLYLSADREDFTVKKDTSKMFIVLLFGSYLSILTSPALATFYTFDGTFDATFPTGSAVPGLAGSWSASFDDAALSGALLETVDINVDSINLSSNPFPGSTYTWNSSNVHTSFDFLRGNLTNNIILGGIGPNDRFGNIDTTTRQTSEIADFSVSYSNLYTKNYDAFFARYSVESEPSTVPGSTSIDGFVSVSATDTFTAPQSSVSFFGGSASSGGLELDFDNDYTGDITVTTAPTLDVQPNFQIASDSGGEFLYYDIGLSQDPGGDVDLAFKYNENSLGTLIESDLVVYHFDESTLMWEALMSNVDTINNIITATTDSFSTFGIGGALIEPGGPNPVPVPAAVWLFGTALIGLVGFGKRKSRIAT